MTNRSDTAADALVERALDQWQKKLIDLTGRNRLLNFQPKDTSAILVRTQDAMTSVDALLGGTTVGLVPGRLDGDDSTRFDYATSARRAKVDRTGSSLDRVMRSLHRRAREALTDRGINVLYLAVGLVHRSDPDGRDWHAPVLLVPVFFESRGTGRAPLLTLGEEDVAVNPALALQLTSIGIELPEPAADQPDLRLYLQSVRRALAGVPSATLDDSVHLSYFSFAKEIMYRDLRDHSDRITAHPVVRGLAGTYWGSDTSPFAFDVVPEERLDDDYPPERDPSPLITDASQRQAVLAGLAGRSFVLDGPPGTGKSQTITNIIASLISDGQTVLFVSEKAAALDVVKSRLEEVGLGRFAFDLHSSKVSRRDVATKLDDALEKRAGLFGSTIGEADLERSAALRLQLNARARAVTRVRLPLGLSVIDAVGRLDGVPTPAMMPPADRERASQIARVDFDDVLRAARHAGAAWDASAPGSTPWWGVSSRRSLAPEMQRLTRATARLEDALEPLAPITNRLALADLSQVDAVVDLVERFHGRPDDLPERWLGGTEFSTVERTVEGLSARLGRYREERRALRALAGVEPELLPSAADSGLAALPTSKELAARTLEEARRRLEFLTESRDRVDRFIDAASRLARVLGQSAPTSPTELETLLEASRLVGLPPRLPEAWASGTIRSGEAWQARDDLVAASSTLRRAEVEFKKYFTEPAFEIDARGLADRFANEHRGLRKLGGAYRADRDLVAEFAREPKTNPKQLIGRLSAIEDRQAAQRNFDDESSRLAPLLGHYFSGRSTNIEVLADAIGNLERLEGFGVRIGRAGIAPVLAGHEAGSVEAVRDAAHEADRLLREHREAFEIAKHPVGGPFPRGALFGTVRQVLTTSIAECRDLIEGLEPWEHVVGAQVSADRLRRLAEEADRVAGLRRGLAERAPKHATVLGPLFASFDTDLDQLHAILAWTHKFRADVGSHRVTLDGVGLAALGAAGSAREMREALQEWTSARTDFVGSFDPDEHPRLRALLTDPTSVRSFLAALDSDDSGRHDYLEFIEARDRIVERGYGWLLDFCVASGVAAEAVGSTFEYGILRDFVDAAIQADPVLDRGRSRGLDEIVDEFRGLDSAVITHGRDVAIGRCNAALPDSRIGNAQIIKHEARKQKRHIAVRDLLDRTRGVVQRLKPCFMMSPLAVSQFLPPRFTFDVVIFDEASQVTPWDAINCIYRGDAFIAAGDPKQLPPTSFFAETTDQDAPDDPELSAAADFESILDLAATSGAFPTVNMNWHYRSRHESLIAFSNASFYDDRLTTFPGPITEDDHVGLELFRVDGVYRRGHERDNPIEAEFVADRVVRHALERPSMTLGVITLSENQARAVSDAVDAAREDHPEIDRFFVDDRLQGFFVKSLENVQGDERDIVIVSTGYGPDAEGKVSNNFGPLSRNGGERRLNVAVTRARSKLEVVTSLNASDIKSSSVSEGSRQLRSYLEYAERGGFVRAPEDVPNHVEESLVRSLAECIRQRGYEVAEHVGLGSYRVDIGIRHPDIRGSFLLGVECDGRSYASAVTARDRDQLRKKVLERLGWRLHRVWTIAWYRDREAELRRLYAAIEEALAHPIEERLLGVPDPAPTEVPEAHRRPVKPVQRDWITPYSNGLDYPNIDLDESPARAYALTSLVEMIVQNEGPIHQRVLEARVRRSAGIGRIGARIRQDLDFALGRANVHQRGDFLDVPGRTLATLRSPSERKFDEVAPEELRAALIGLIGEAAEISQDELFRELILLTSSRGTSAVYRALGILADELVHEGAVSRHLGVLTA